LNRILGIVLVRNEDRFVRQAILNAWEFCDHLLLVDHRSVDRTPEILRELAAQAPEKATFHAIGHPGESHNLLKPHVGSRTWVFAVDGDELYDPERLAEFRKRLVGGEFDRHWMILGNVLHCEDLDLERDEAAGYLSPPARSITKLYNFSAISAWDGDTPERLHGGTPVFRPGFDGQDKRQLQLESSWDAAPLRCLHACFVPRSSRDGGVRSRENIMETYCGGWTNRLRRFARRMAGRQEVSEWKRECYARGQRVTVRTQPFFPEP
jgi:glycosyltransferase involved in cell wall biosynthesis